MLDAVAALNKALLYAALLSCAGCVVATETLHGSRTTVRFAERVIRLGAAWGAVFAVVGALVLLWRLGGELDSATLTAVFISSVGAALGMQLSGIALVWTALDDASARGIRLSSVGLLTLSFAFQGHAFYEGLAQGLVAFVHVSLAAWWIGALWLLRHACRTLPDHLITLLRRFSAQAFVAVGLLVFVGFALIVALVSWEQLPALTDYQRNLAIKLFLVVGALTVALYNKVALTNRIVAGDATAIATLRKSITVELALIGAVLIATAVLTTYTSPHD